MFNEYQTGGNVMFNDTIDTKKGMAYLAGKKEIYIKIANTFVKGSEKKMEDLKRFYEQGDFERLLIEFHGLKSSSASVGSTLLPVVAIELEVAGKQGNFDLIKEKFDAFIEQYKDTCGALEEAISQL